MAGSDPADARDGVSDELARRSIARILPRARAGLLVALAVGALLGVAIVPAAGWIPQAGGGELALIGLGLVLGALVLARLARVLSRQLRDTVETAQQNAGLAQQLRAALASQQEAQRAHARLLDAASRDLRQPVQALLSLADRFRSASGQAPREALAGQMARTAESIDAMFRHLVDFAQLDAGTLEAEVREVPLDRLVHAAVSGFGEKCAARGLAFRLHMEDSCTILADPDLLERLLRHFLDNARKFSLRGEIALRVCREGAQAVVTVEDQGVGMDAADLAQAFHPFHRGRSASVAEAGGAGLGLAICRQVAQRTGAQVVLQSRLGVGTSISVRLPLAAGAAAPSQREAPRQALPALLVAVREDGRLARDAL